MIKGNVGSQTLEWRTLPRGKSGESELMINNKQQKVRWVRDDQGIWIETDIGFFGYDVRKSTNDDGQPIYQLFRRRQFSTRTSLGFLKPGEEQKSTSAGAAKKNAKVKSQMPGKISRILVKSGDRVVKGQSLMVMEAMKMENEIKSTLDSVIQEVKVVEGQAVETGSVLIVFE